MTADTMYKRHIMELYSEKPNYGTLKNKTHDIKLKNPGCQDEITIQLEINKKGVIKDAKFSGITCFISTIAASALLENIKGMTLEQVKKLNKKDIDSFLGINVIPTRINCELLPLEALKRIN